MLLKLISKIQAWKIDDQGATAIEYGLIAAGIAVAISAVVFTFGTDLAALFAGLSGTITGAGAGDGGAV